jgi:NDP-sugar pyrophosphorylase family protein
MIAQGRTALLLCGGRGTRLGPFTTVLPKPLLPIGDRAILETVVEQLERNGFNELVFAVGYLAHLIEAVFGEGDRYGARIAYNRETRPLGTAGPLAAMRGQLESFLVMNGDVLTDLDFGELMAVHEREGAILTVAARQRVEKSDYGVLQTAASGPGLRVVGYDEKPVREHLVSMGVYAARPEIAEFVAPGERIDLPDLVVRLLERGEAVACHRHEGLWLDIGRHEDYEAAIGRYGDGASGGLAPAAAVQAALGRAGA